MNQVVESFWPVFGRVENAFISGFQHGFGQHWHDLCVEEGDWSKVGAKGNPFEGAFGGNGELHEKLSCVFIQRIETDSVRTEGDLFLVGFFSKRCFFLLSSVSVIKSQTKSVSFRYHVTTRIAKLSCAFDYRSNNKRNFAHHDETLLLIIIMNRSSLAHPEPSSSTQVSVADPTVLAQIYDQYAPVLLGIIVATVRDEAEAARVLEITFKEIYAQYGQFRPESQPLFVWLLSIARRAAREAVKSQPKANPSVFRLVRTGEGLNAPIKVNAGTPVTVALPENKLLDAVFFGNCTLEEATSSVGLPIEPARQQLRLAMQQLRGAKSV